jgi:hypothetical protein
MSSGLANSALGELIASLSVLGGARVASPFIEKKDSPCRDHLTREIVAYGPWPLEPEP